MFRTGQQVVHVPTSRLTNAQKDVAKSYLTPNAVYTVERAGLGGTRDYVMVRGVTQAQFPTDAFVSLEDFRAGKAALDHEREVRREERIDPVLADAMSQDVVVLEPEPATRDLSREFGRQVQDSASVPFHLVERSLEDRAAYLGDAFKRGAISEDMRDALKAPDSIDDTVSRANSPSESFGLIDHGEHSAYRILTDPSSRETREKQALQVIAAMLEDHSNYGDVRRFHEKFGMPTGETPALLDDELTAYRYKFMSEELEEYREACGDNDIEKAFDALIDLVYVTLGTCLFHGFPWQAGWARVQTANMAKVRSSGADDERSHRGHVFDVVKPDGWVSPDLSDLVGIEKKPSGPEPRKRRRK